MDLLLLDDPIANFPKNHQLNRLQLQAQAPLRPQPRPDPPAAAEDAALARPESDSGSPAVPPRLDPAQVGSLVSDIQELVLGW